MCCQDEVQSGLFLRSIDLKKSFVFLGKGERVSCYQGVLHEIQALDDIHALSLKNGCDIAFALPFRVIRERGFEARGDEPILAIEAETVLTVSKEAMLDALPLREIALEGEIQSSLSDEAYADLVRSFQQNEIEAGNASQATLARCFTGRIVAFDMKTALAVYRRVLLQHGYYFAVLYAQIDPLDPTKSLYIIGATPERHLEIRGNEALMTPIAGTLRKEDQATFETRLMAFLRDPKEINELFQVVDEEMKIMGVICPEGGEIAGPFLHEVGAVVHTEYELVGRRGPDTIAALRRTLFAPTVVGSPMESAARILAKYEPVSRRYYAGVVGVYRCPPCRLAGVKPDGDLDSAIFIRCAEIAGDGTFRVQAGGGLVRDSDPLNEAKESRAKAMGLLGILTGARQVAEPYLTDPMREACRGVLESRNTYLSSFLMNRQNPYVTERPKLKGLRVSILNNEDDFAFMIGHMLTVMQAKVRVVDSMLYDPEQDDAEIVVLGPGPGDPCDMAHPRMKNLQRLISILKGMKKPLLGICLGHQVLAVHDGIPVLRQKESTQGLQREVSVGGKPYRLGFYNSFSPVFDEALLARQDVRFDLDDAGRIIAMKGARFVGYQFHPESIMSTDGADLIYEALIALRQEK